MRRDLTAGSGAGSGPVLFRRRQPLWRHRSLQYWRALPGGSGAGSGPVLFRRRQPLWRHRSLQYWRALPGGSGAAQARQVDTGAVTETLRNGVCCSVMLRSPPTSLVCSFCVGWFVAGTTGYRW